jgi:hypothetical protein
MHLPMIDIAAWWFFTTVEENTCKVFHPKDTHCWLALHCKKFCSNMVLKQITACICDLCKNYEWVNSRDYLFIEAEVSKTWTTLDGSFFLKCTQISLENKSSFQERFKNSVWMIKIATSWIEAVPIQWRLLRNILLITPIFE